LTDCDRTFNLVNVVTDGDASELKIDSATGEVSLEYTSTKSTYSFGIEVTNTGGSDGTDHSAAAFNPSLTIDGTF
jgi:hypothetical protein